MSLNTRVLIVSNIKLPINASLKEAFSVSRKKLANLGADLSSAEFKIFRKSIDARKKQEICFVYSVAVLGAVVSVSDEILIKHGITPFDNSKISFDEHGDDSLKASPLIVGSGPCGLFAALILAEQGYKPILIERGGSVKERQYAVDQFKKFHILDENTNIQFGAGGAGTFSDGKLITRINDPMTSYVLERFVDFGAPEEILHLARPHIGTDILSKIVDKIIDRIKELGGEVRFHTQYLNSKTLGEKTVAVTSNGDIPYGVLILAIGHSARDTYEMLINSGYAVEAKNFSVGMRIEHLTDDIDHAMYGDFVGHPALGHAEYNLSHNTKVRGVYTFCMCPGGEVVAAASESHGVVVNGMSSHSRDGLNSNSAVVCSVFRDDFGATPAKAIAFQRMIENAAYTSAGGDYSAPIITVGDFMRDECTKEPTRVIPTYMDGSHVKLISPYKYLPKFVCDGIKGALPAFDKKIHGFASDTAILTGAETRTSAPIRILRDQQTMLALGKENIYPCGEGAGYAGGITSAAIDGIKTAVAIIKKYAPISGDEI